jgi:Na+/phosphate symporter
MNPLWMQLAGAYRQEEQLYFQVLELVSREHLTMEAELTPASVLELCAKVEKLMAEVSAIEDGITPAKREWEKTREDPQGELREVLTSIESTIGQITRIQESVQAQLLECMRRQREATQEAQARISASRARRLYDSGKGEVA